MGIKNRNKRFSIMTKSTSKSTGRKDLVYQIVTDKILGCLKKGRIPWKKPWDDTCYTGLEHVNSKGKSYRGINPILLAISCQDNGFKSNTWYTFNQVKEMAEIQKKDIHVKKGSKGTQIVFWKILERENKKVDSDDDVDEKTITQIPLLRYYTVFNRDQIEGLPAKPAAKKSKISADEKIKAAEKIITGYKSKPPVVHGGNRAYYSPANDEIGMPVKKQFKSLTGYYSTLFHECIHSTGHKSRLNREDLMKMAAHGDKNYSREELTAEIGAAFLNARAGILDATIENSQAYIQSWIKALNDDPKMVVYAAARAQKAADYINGEMEE